MIVVDQNPHVCESFDGGLTFKTISPPLVSNPAYNSYEWSFSAAACSTKHCVVGGNACLFANQQCDYAFSSVFLLDIAARSWSVFNTSYMYELACAKQDGTFALTDGAVVTTVDPGASGEQMLFNGSPMQLQVQDFHCGGADNLVYLGGYVQQGGSNIWSLSSNGTLSRVSSFSGNWDITAITVPKPSM